MAQYDDDDFNGDLEATPPSDDGGGETLQATVSTVIWQQPGSDFKILKMDDDTTWVGIVGESTGKGYIVKARGHWTPAKRRGYPDDFKIAQVLNILPFSKDGLKTWLMDRLPDIGEARAEALVKMFPGETLFHTIEHEPEKLTEIRGITPARAKQIQEAYAKYAPEREMVVQLTSLGIPYLQAQKAAKIKDIKQLLIDDPFELVSLPGFSFQGMKDFVLLPDNPYGMQSSDPRIVRAYARELLHKAADGDFKFPIVPLQEGGNCTLTREQMLMLLRPYRQIYSDDELQRFVSSSKHLVWLRGGDVLLQELEAAESNVASIILQKLSRRSGQLEVLPFAGTRLDESQKIAASALVQLPIAVMTGGPGCHVRGQKLLQADGHFVAVEDVRVGSTLAGQDGHRTVLETKRGRGRMVRVVPVKGQSFVVNEDHILTLVHSLTDVIFDISIKDYLQLPEQSKIRSKSKLLRVAVDRFEGEAVELPIDPYFLGVLLGDGHLGPTVSVCKNDPAIRACCEREAARFGLKLRVQDDGERALQFFFTRTEDYGPNPLSEILKSLKLFNTRSGDKFIPHSYKTAQRADRLALFAGLVDTDGHNTNNCIDYVSKSEALADDFAFLARSLGFAAYVHPKTAGCQTGAVGQYYRVSVSGDLQEIPTRIPRKQFAERLQKKDALRTGFTIEPAGEDDFYGFTLDGNGRYLMDDFTITHNTGKTTTLKAALDAVEARGAQVKLASPTGKAAKRMTETTGRPAQTIHKLLEWGPGKDEFGVETFDFRRNENNPIEADVVVIDEASMLDIKLASSLFSALGNARIILVGDEDQLPPVGPGQTLTDVMKKQKDGRHVVPTFRLTHTYRQAADSWVIDNAKRIIQGQIPSLKNQSDFQFIETRERDTNAILSAVITIYRESKAKGQLADLQVLCPMKKPGSGASTFEINNAVQEALNPISLQPKSYPNVPGGDQYKIFEGDKVIFTKNNAELGLVNGDTGYVEAIDVPAGDVMNASLLMRVDGMVNEEREDGLYKLRGSDFKHLLLAYAMTIHKSQGSEWKEVVVVMDLAHSAMLKRQLLYTAVTRTSRYLRIVGQRSAVERAARSPLSNKRQTLLFDRIAKGAS